MQIDYKMDGKNHINVYSKGQTDLGRWLSNFNMPPDLNHIDTPHGRFRNIEGLWHWLGHRHEPLRTMDGWEAKEWSKGRKRSQNLPLGEFISLIEDAVRFKVYNSPTLMKALKESTLPFLHYYVYNGRTVEASFEWLTWIIEYIRNELKVGR